MPKTKTVSQGAPTRQSPRAKKARLEAEKEADKETTQVLDLTESSDDEIQEITKPKGKKSLKPPSKQQSNSKDKAAASSANLATYMKSIAADYEQKMAAKKREEYIKSFLARPSEAQLQAQRQQAYAQQMYMRQMQALMTSPTPFQTLASSASTINAAKETTPTANKVEATPKVISVSDQNSAPKTTVSSQSTSSTDSQKNDSSGKSSSKTGNGDKMNMEFETGYKCVRCLEIFDSKFDLKHHTVKYHTDALNFKCGKCGEVFTKQEKLEKHERGHGRQKTYVCVECEQSFYSLENLKRHEKVHEKKVEHKCSGCTRVYTDMEKLVMHERIHKKAELPFQCRACGEGFRAGGNLKMHMRVAHKALKPTKI